MKVEMVMPQMGESIAEATISKWLKQPGDSVQKDEIILEISTDKVDSEIPSPASGLVAALLFKQGDVVPVKTVIALIDTSGAAAQPSVNESKPAAVHPAPAKLAVKTEATPTPAPRAAAAAIEAERFFSPLVKSLAQKHAVPLSELAQLAGSGQGGRVTKEDFLTFVQRKAPGAKERTQAAVPPSRPAVAGPTAQTTPPAMEWDERGEKVVLMDNMRQLIAEHMVRSKHTSAHVYSVQEVDMSGIAKYRARKKNEFQAREGFGLSFTPFFLEAAVKGLNQFPQINSSVDGKSIIYKKHVNLGCAVALGTGGLIVPVIKHAEERNFVGLARALNDLAARARNKKLLPDDVRDGTFTVTNPGVFGTMLGTPVINQPQVAILCLGAIKKRPVVIDDMIAIREICYLTLSYDHRIIDGALGGQYLAFVREYLESWDMERPLH